MGNGYLKVELRTASGALPVGGIHIQVKNIQTGTLYNLVSDESGNTIKVKLYAPDTYHTLDPNDPGPYYSTYDVEVRSEKGYKGAIIHGVQIFDKETSILPVQLKPLLKGSPQEPTMEEIDIPPMFGVQMLKETPPIEVQKLFSGANEIIIPEYMTVHLGTPNSESPNVRVPFIDYVKNVASSEIFPSWPEASLEANIYAQISFALNRIYTVWYRSRGYAFDITNSTTVDQYFVDGRNIFENISILVDRIFNMFIRRRGRLEPFFAQYCNGTTSTCNGLSQWGTVPLAENGYTPIEILKEFYPSDIQIEESNNFSSNVQTYPGSPLREGSVGADVRTMQNYLNRVSANWPLIPQITAPNGTFGSSTANAVRTFQETFDLPVDGVIGKQTWYKITSIYVGVKRLAELDSEGERIGIGLVPPSTVLREGARGEDVVELQFILNFIGEFYPTIPFLIEDGSFGPSTKRSVTEFQKEFGLTPDGVVGPATWNKLYEVFKSIDDTVVIPPEVTPPEVIPPEVIPPEVIPPEVIYPPFPGTLLRVGSQGSDVLLMQQYLNAISNVHASIPKLVADGIFGNNTQIAVMAFQKLFGLTPDGIIGNNTWNKIVTVYNGIASQTSPSFPGTSLRAGSTGSYVTLMQQYLNGIAAVNISIPKLTVDGIFGNKMQSAVIAFQSYYGLTPDGIIGRLTWERIIAEYNKISSGRLMTQMLFVRRMIMGF